MKALENKVMIINTQIKNKKEIMNFINKHESIDHDLVENGSSTYNSHNLKN